MSSLSFPPLYSANILYSIRKKTHMEEGAIAWAEHKLVCTCPHSKSARSHLSQPVSVVETVIY